MIYTNLTKKALTVCFDAHKDDVDKSGMPYVFHPFHVAEQMDDEVSTIVALLHDVVEDHSDKYPFEVLEGMGFGDEAMEALHLLTHEEGESYMDYVRKIKTNPIARKVKLADLAHNSDSNRLDTITPEDEMRLEKYEEAKKELLL